MPDRRPQTQTQPPCLRSRDPARPALQTRHAFLSLASPLGQTDKQPRRDESIRSRARRAAAGSPTPMHTHAHARTAIIQPRHAALGFPSGTALYADLSRVTTSGMTLPDSRAGARYRKRVSARPRREGSSGTCLPASWRRAQWGGGTARCCASRHAAARPRAGRGCRGHVRGGGEA